MKRLAYKLTLGGLALLGSASAQVAALDARGSLELSLNAPVTLAEVPSPPPGWLLAGHLTLGYDLRDLVQRDLSASVVLDPSAQFGVGNPTLEAGVTEAYVRLSERDFDLSAGLERLPLETARLSVPYGLERVDARGIRSGLPGVRATYYTSDWRVSGMALYQGALEDAFATENIVPLASAKRDFGRFDLTAQALYAGEAVIGLGGSGLIDPLVVYGEAWLLTDPLDARAALGLSGFWGDATWTLEAAYLTPSLGSLKGQPSAGDPTTPPAERPPRPALLGLIAKPLGERRELNLSTTAGAFFDTTLSDTFYLASTTLSVLGQDAELGLSAASVISQEATLFNLNLNVKHYF